MSDTATTSEEAVPSDETLRRLAVRVAGMEALVDEMAERVRLIDERTAQLVEVVEQVGAVIESFGPMAEQLAEGGPGAILAMLGRARQ